MNRDPENRGQPDGAAADGQFESIVAGWRREGGVPTWPADDTRAATGPPTTDTDRPGPGPSGQPGAAPGDPTAEPAAPPADPGADPGAPPYSAVQPSPGPPARPAAGPPLPASDDDHFVPPEPPPFPAIGPPALVGLGLLGMGLALVVAPNWLGVPDRYGLPLGLVGIAAGLGWLVLRLWPDPPPPDDGSRPDDGAIL